MWSCATAIALGGTRSAEANVECMLCGWKNADFNAGACFLNAEKTERVLRAEQWVHIHQHPLNRALVRNWIFLIGCSIFYMVRARTSLAPTVSNAAQKTDPPPHTNDTWHCHYTYGGFVRDSNRGRNVYRVRLTLQPSQCYSAYAHCHPHLHG